MSDQTSQECVYGVHPVRQALETGARHCYKIVLEKDKNPARLRDIQSLAKSRKIRIESLPRDAFRKRFGEQGQQGVVGFFAPVPTLGLRELMERALKATERPVVVLLDGIQDPQNLGALIRSAYVLGMQGIVVPRHRAVPLNETVARCSAGAIEHLPVSVVTNLNNGIAALKDAGFWIVGVDMEGNRTCDRFEFDMPVALVIGGEGKGLRLSTRKACDFIVAIPMDGQLGSLNASAAGAILFYEILRQRRAAPPSKQKKD
ncbi:23S rRNA (Guanosine-2'-O-)-methyltransferase RlmB [Nitrospina gracilis 3/211]|uniref:23S rRNA (Guanosine-2'-O-)-methyltransferase RlmB n=1 Tax=Nitrospina gracilis (strain 3/211) TaxID=1266370 RepID=M1YFJ6_NITG3|nr:MULTISPECIES: 23S rRNA (guanosine(2251)-2'-O)-methyltransferase RlmB [Nitrospina]MCF8722525.1 23S rRNA (guanosine2251-2'-O)-methyltransferase [Nitrospina sp. Nb-3]CCQ89201.1 23S rRNA (Guanosine-2'-O-)-methyltransferase RlmB [Nitrospina gracilis 3/211]